MSKIEYFSRDRQGKAGTHVLLADRDGQWYWFNDQKKWEPHKAPSFDDFNEYDLISQEQAKQIMKQDHT